MANKEETFLNLSNNNQIHIALIPDGNRRWAKKKGLSSWAGHAWGARALQKILDEAFAMGIYCVTFWGGSYDNLTKRTSKEIHRLFKVYDKWLAGLSKRKWLEKHKIKVKVLGRFRELLPKETIKIINEIEKATEKNNGKFFNILIGYSGTDEMVDAVRSIAVKNLRPEEISEEIIKQNLWTSATPPVDLIIRTGEESDPHNSAGFMMFDAAYSQYYFTETLWPDFKPEEFRRAIKKFLKTERRVGK